jgi:hypothetical protein
VEAVLSGGQTLHFVLDDARAVLLLTEVDNARHERLRLGAAAAHLTVGPTNARSLDHLVFWEGSLIERTLSYCWRAAPFDVC